MEKIALDVLHEVELYSNSDLNEFTAQVVFLTKDKMQFAFDLDRKKDEKTKFTFKIPKKLEEFFSDPVKYKVYVYVDSARFLADEGSIQVVSASSFTTKLPDTKTETPKVKPKENKPTKPKPETPKEVKEEVQQEPITNSKTPVPDKKAIDLPKELTEIRDTSRRKIDLDEILEQHEKISKVLETKESSKNKRKSLRDYTARIERVKTLEKDKEKLNEKVKNILSDFNSKK